MSRRPLESARPPSHGMYAVQRRGVLYHHWQHIDRLRRANYNAGVPVYMKGSRFALASHQAQWLNPAAFSAAPNSGFGSAGFGQVLLPSLQQVDATLSKVFAITERVSFKFQADAFNALNHTNYSSLGTTATSGSSFGRLSGAYPNRQLQLGAKVTF